MSFASQILRPARSVPSRLLIAGLALALTLLLGCGQESSTETSAPAKSEAAAEKDQKPIFDSDFEEGNTEEWTETKTEDSEDGGAGE